MVSYLVSLRLIVYNISDKTVIYQKINIKGQEIMAHPFDRSSEGNQSQTSSLPFKTVFLSETSSLNTLSYLWYTLLNFSLYFFNPLPPLFKHIQYYIKKQIFPQTSKFPIHYPYNSSPPSNFSRLTNRNKANDISLSRTS